MTSQHLTANVDELAWEKQQGLLPVIVQDVESAAVLMLGYMNREALAETLACGRVVFYSRSKQRLWMKGEQSGHYLELVSIYSDCDGDTLLVQAKPQGPVCHLGDNTCFQGSNDTDWGFVKSLTQVIADREANPSEKSYVTGLLAQGVNKVAQKVGEEAVEVALAGVAEDDQALANEVADLLFHLLILLHVRQLSISEVITVMRQRR